MAHGDDGVSANAMAAARAVATVSSAAADVAAAAKAAKKAGDENATASALQIDDEPCAVMLSATGLMHALRGCGGTLGESFFCRQTCEG